MDNELAPQGKELLPIIFTWFKEKDWLYKWEASRLINNIYPQFDSELESILLKMIKDGGKVNAGIISHVLDSYKGEIFTHPVCKEFIKKYNDKKYLSAMKIFLSKTGVVMGEYGLVDAYKNKIAEIQDWKKDKDPRIKLFATDYEKGLNKQILWEKKSADDGIEMRKKSYGG